MLIIRLYNDFTSTVFFVVHILKRYIDFAEKACYIISESIRYIYNSNMGIELIFCENSTISYPTHNHVSVLTIGIVLKFASAIQRISMASVPAGMRLRTQAFMTANNKAKGD